MLLRRMIRASLAMLVVILVTSCATTAQRAVGLDRPLLTWHGDPGTTASVTWFRGDADSLSLVSPDGTRTDHPAEFARGVARVTLDALDPGSEYRYTLGVEETEYRFRTLDLDHSDAGAVPLRFAVLGDLQPFNAETDRTVRLVMEKVASLEPQFVLQTGDVSEVGISVASFRRAVDALSVLGARVPVVAAAGNHDYYYGLPSARTFKALFPYPYAGRDGADGAQNPRRDTWYSIDVGPLHVAVLDTEASGAAHADQMTWLAADLPNARDRGATWVFVVMHRPILATATVPDRLHYATSLFPIIAEHGVDAVFWGHDHLFEHYEYRYGANGFVLNPGDAPAARPVHLFTVGTSGARVDSLYGGFFDRKPYAEPRTLYRVGSDEPVERVFMQRPWNRAMRMTEGAGVRYQDPAVYPEAASFYHFPFDSASDFATRTYSTDPARAYSDDSSFFGYTYGEGSIHYLWIEIEANRMVISAHYADGPRGAQGTIMTTPDGTPLRWEIAPARAGGFW